VPLRGRLHPCPGLLGITEIHVAAFDVGVEATVTYGQQRLLGRRTVDIAADHRGPFGGEADHRLTP
jgi:hypothetical protein